MHNRSNIVIGPSRSHEPGLGDELEKSNGYSFWRSLEELQRQEDFGSILDQEFPVGASEWTDEYGRRRFLKLMSASLALAGVHGCVSAPPLEDIVPFVDPPEGVTPGQSQFYATSFPFRGYAHGVLVESREGRPIKIEGNPDHPASLGSTHAFAQASILDLYDPDRSRAVRSQGRAGTWDDFVAEVRARLEGLQDSRRLRVLTGTVTSPSLAAQIRALLNAYPGAMWHVHDSVDSSHEQDGLHLALGRRAQAVYRVESADVILAIDSDFLFSLAGSLAYARGFSNRRRVREGQTDMSRLYVAESSISTTGAVADHRLPLSPREIERFVRTLDGALGSDELDAAAADAFGPWLSTLVRDIRAHPRASLVIAGESLSPELHALVHRINERTGGVGVTLDYIRPVSQGTGDSAASIEVLAEDMRSGRVDTLIVLGGNPIYSAPADLEFEEALERVPFSVHVSPYVDETSHRTLWHIPRTHYLEEWGDLRAFDGTPSLVQPLIAPLYQATRSDAEVVAAVAGASGESAYQLLRQYWRRAVGQVEFDAWWTSALRAGVAIGALDPASEQEAEEQEVETGSDSFEVPFPESSEADDGSEQLEIVFRPDSTVWDGRFANNGWLQELPKPITKLTWDNAALVSPELAERLVLKNEQIVELSVEGRSVQAPIWIVPGLPPRTVTVHLGYGRARSGATGSDRGFDANKLRTSASPHSSAGLRITPTGGTHPLATTQHHHAMRGRRLVVQAPVFEFRGEPHVVHDEFGRRLPSLYPDYEYSGYKWGMVIDLSTCIGCNACVVACQAENNIPVVGKEEVRRGREMHWLRIDRYYRGDPAAPTTVFQPVPCMHCEKAPCEVVCPVYATVHDSEGLNVMVYNRCVGTRYCSNNCPYKVRRFNFLQYAHWSEDARSLQRNPEVTVRSRGVMEKCTYCIQRIAAARIRAKKEDRRIQDGEVITACQAACPTQTITFGDLNDEQSLARSLREQPHNYGLLHELGTGPRTTYLARITNPSPSLPEAS